MKRKGNVIYFVVITLIFLIMAWIRCIPFNIFLLEGLAYIIWYCIFIAIGIIVTTASGSISNILTGNRIYFDKKKFRIAILIPAIPILIYIIMLILGSPLFSSKQYKEQLGEAEQKEFTDDVQAIDVNQIPVVDLELASKLAEKKLGEKPALGSQVVLGEPTIQQVNQKLIWVVPLEHSGIFKWLNNLDGTPGYITVSATNPSDVTYVDNYKIKYQPSSYLTQDLERSVRFGKGLTQGLTDFSFELNDNGEPFWVVTTYQNSRFMSLPETTGVIIVNAQTGEQNKYNLNEIPDWVDRVQPRSFIKNQIENQGEYINGIFNFSNKDKYTTSQGSAVVYNEGKCYMFTGLTSVGSDEAAIGFYMIDLKTKHVIRYNLSGATENAAQKSAEGKVQNLKYEASFPIVTNVNGVPTYFMTLKDKEGLIKQYAFVSIKDYTIVGTGDSIENAMKNYEQVMRNTGGTENITGSSKETEITGTIDRIGVEQSNSGTVYKIILKEEPSKIYICSYDISEELAITQIGDKVKIKYYLTDKTAINSTNFDNMNYNQK